MGVDLSIYRARIGRFYCCQNSPLLLKKFSVGPKGSTLGVKVATLSMCIFVYWMIFQITFTLDENVTKCTSTSWLSISDFHNVLFWSASMSMFTCWAITEILFSMRVVKSHTDPVHNLFRTQAKSQKVLSIYRIFCWMLIEMLLLMSGVEPNPGPRTGKEMEKVVHFIWSYTTSVSVLLLLEAFLSCLQFIIRRCSEKLQDMMIYFLSQSRQTDAENLQTANNEKSAILNNQIEKSPFQNKDASQFSASRCSPTTTKLNKDTVDKSAQSSLTDPRQYQDTAQYSATSSSTWPLQKQSAAQHLSSSSSATDVLNMDNCKSNYRVVPKNQINNAKPCHYLNKRKRYTQIQSLGEDPVAMNPSSLKYSKTGHNTIPSGYERVSLSSSQTVRGYNNLNTESATGFVETEDNMTDTASSGLVESENNLKATQSRSFVEMENTTAATSTSIVETVDTMTTSASGETKTVTFPLLDIVAQKDNSAVDNPNNKVTAIQQIFNVARTTNTNVNFSVDLSNSTGPVQFGQTNVVANSKDTDSSSSESDREIRSTSRRTKRYKREYLRSEELQNTIDNTSALIDGHCSDKTFVSTAAVIKGYEILLKKNVLIYAGDGSIGKTKNALAILRYFRDESDIGKDYTIIKLHSFVQWNILVSSSKKMLVFLDNIFSERDMNNSCLNQLDQFSEIMWSCVSKGNVKAIITTRQLVTPSDMKKVEKYKLFNKEHIIDLSSEEHTLTLEEKIEILRRHLRERNISIENPIQSSLSKDSSPLRKFIDEETLKIYAYTNPYLGYPYTCFLFCFKFFNLGIDFFKHPHYHLIREIDMLATSENRVDNIQYCILVVTMLHNGRFECEVDQDAISEIARKFKFKSPTLPKIKCSLDALQNTLLCRSFGKRSVFEFKHGTILEATAVSYGNYFPDSMIKTCNLNFLCKLVRTESCCDNENQDRFMIIEKQHFRNMAERLFKELDNGNILDIVYHPVLTDNDFLEVFCETLESSGNQTLLCKKCEPPHILYINGKFHFVHTFFDVCCLLGKNNIVKRIITFDIVTESGLLLACSQGHDEIVDNITDKQSDFSDYCKLKLCHEACISGNYDMVKILKRKFKNSFYEKSSSTDLPIISAATEKHENIVKVLVDFKANIPVYECKRLFQTCHTNGWRDLSSHIKHLYNLSFGKFDSYESTNIQSKDTKESKIEGSSVPASKLKEKRLLCKGVIHKKLNGKCYKKRGPSVVRKFAKYGMISKMKQLVKSKMDSLNKWNLVNEKGDDGQSAILVAAEAKQKRIVRYLLDLENIDVTVSGNDGDTLLHYCARYNWVDITRHLFKQFTDQIKNVLNQRGLHGQTPIVVAASNNSKQVAKLLIDQNMVDITITDDDNDTLLHKCAWNGEIDIFQACCKKFVQTDFERNHAFNKIGKNGLSVIMSAAVKKQKRFVAKLLTYPNLELNFTTKNHTRMSVFYYCILHSWNDILRICLEQNYVIHENGSLSESDMDDIMIPDKLVKSIILTAVFADDHKLVQYVFKRKEKDYEERGHANCFMQYCVKRNWLTIIKIAFKYIKQGTYCSLLNHKNEKGQTILLFSAHYGRKEIVRELLQKPTDTLLIDNHGNNLLYYCIEKRWMHLVKLIFETMPVPICQTHNCEQNNSHVEMIQSILDSQEIHLGLGLSFTQNSIAFNVINTHGHNILCFRNARWSKFFQKIFSDYLYQFQSVHLFQYKKEQEKIGIYVLATFRHLQTLKQIVEHFIMKEEVDIVLNGNCDSVLHVCAKYGWSDMCKIIFSQTRFMANIDNIVNHKGENGECVILRGIRTMRLRATDEVEKDMANDNRHLQNTVYELLQHDKTDFTVTDDDGYNILHYCTECGWKEILMQVLYRFDTRLRREMLNKYPSGSETVLLLAAHHKKIKIVQDLLSVTEVDFKAIDTDRNNILHLCAMYGWNYLIRKIFNCLVNKEDREILLNSKGFEGNSVILIGAKSKQKDVVFELLSIEEVSIILTDNYGNNVLHWCIKNEWNDVTEIILRKNSNSDARSQLLNEANISGKNAILMAAQLKLKSLLQYLLAFPEADITMTDNEGHNIIHFCLQYIDEDIIRHLLKRFDTEGSTNYILSSTDCFGNNILHHCARKGLSNIIKEILNQLSNDTFKTSILNQRGKDDRSVLLEAAISGQKQTVLDLMMYSEVDLTVIDSDGNNILYLCARNLWHDAIKRMLKGKICDNQTRNILFTQKSKSKKNILLEILEISNDVSNEGILDRCSNNCNGIHDDATKQIVIELLKYKELDITITANSGCNILHWCVKCRWWDIMTNILNVKCDDSMRKTLLNQRDDNDRNVLLIIAAYYGILGANTKEIVTNLLKYKELDVTITDKSGCNILHWCVRWKWWDIMRDIINVKCDASMRETLLYQKDVNGRNVLILIADYYDFRRTGKQMVTDLLKYKELDLTITDKNVCNILHWCVKCRWWDIITDILNVKCDDVMRKTLLNQKDVNGRNVLMAIADYSANNKTRKQMVLEMFKYAELDITISDKSGWNILHWCVKCRWRDIMTDILNVKRNESLRKTLLNQRDVTGRNVLIFIAHYNGNNETGTQTSVGDFHDKDDTRKQMVIDLLKYKELDITITGEDGWNILHWCVVYRWWDIMTNILYVNCDECMRETLLNQTDLNGRNVLIFAAKFLGNDEIRKQMVVDLLMHKELDVTVTDKNGWTILHWCVVYRCWDIMTTILNVKCDDSMRENLLNQRDLNGRNVLIFLANFLGNDENRKQIVVDLLMYKELDVTITDENGCNVLHWCVRQRWWDVMKDIIYVKCDYSMKKTLLNQRDLNGRNVLIFIANFLGNDEIGKQMVVDLLKYKELDLTTTDADGWNILHWCVKHRWWDAMTDILNVKCDGFMRTILLNQKDLNGRNVLILIADHCGNDEIGKQIVIDLLRYKELDLTITGADGWNILHWCVKHRWWDAMTDILNTKCDGSMRTILLNQKDAICHDDILMKVASDFKIDGNLRKQIVFDILQHKELNINMTNSDGLGILHLCIREGWTENIMYILNKKCNTSSRKHMLNQKDTQGTNILLKMAVSELSIENWHNTTMIKDLLSFPELDTKITDNNENNILHLCVICGRPDVLKELLEFIEIDLTDINKDGNNVLHMCAEAPNSRGIINHILHNKCNSITRNIVLNQQGSNKQSVILKTIVGPNEETIFDLLQFEELDLTTTDANGNNILHYCLMYGWVDMIYYILDKICDDVSRTVLLNQRDTCGKNILMKIARQYQRNTLENLLKYDNIDLSITDVDGNNILNLCSNIGFDYIIFNILNNKCDVTTRRILLNQKNLEGNTVLMGMAIDGRQNSLKIMLKFILELDVRIMDDKSENILHKCAKQEWTEIATDILDDIKRTDRKTVLNQRNFLGDSVIMHAARNKNKGLVLELLKYKEVDISISDNNGNDLLSFCDDHGWEDIRHMIS